MIILTNTEKGRLLHNLFPEELPLFLDHLENVCADFMKDKDSFLANWDDGFIEFEFWFQIAKETAEILKRKKLAMAKSSKVFCDQLFFTYTSLFVYDQIIKYADKYSINDKFKIAVDLLFK